MEGVSRGLSRSQSAVAETEGVKEIDGVKGQRAVEEISRDLTFVECVCCKMFHCSRNVSPFCYFAISQNVSFRLFREIK